MIKTHTKKKLMLCMAVAAIGCAHPSKNIKTVDPLSKRPASQIKFMNVVDSIRNDYSDDYGNATKMDMRIERFNRYALDSLKEVKDWIVVVNEISDSPMDANTTSTLLFNTDDVYNLKMYSTIRNYAEKEYDKSLDSLNHPQADVVFLTYTIPKAPKDEKLKKTPGDYKKTELGRYAIDIRCNNKIEQRFKTRL